jgi:predicted nucleic acid-binding protein
MSKLALMIFFDTQVASTLAKADAEWSNRFWRRIKNEFKYVISPLTIFELLFGLANSEQSYFGEQKERFRVLMGTSQPRVWPLPEDFALKKVFKY